MSDDFVIVPIYIGIGKKKAVLSYIFCIVVSPQDQFNYLLFVSKDKDVRQ